MDGGFLGVVFIVLEGVDFDGDGGSYVVIF